jgi:chemotaxis protein methyltransferase CheR
MAPALRERVRFEVFNLNLPPSAQAPWPGPFDCVFLRNMLIYFDDEARTRIVRRVLDTLAPDGLLVTGHAESLTGLGLPLRLLAPAVYALA